jgi:hypothetical protein
MRYSMKARIDRAQLMLIRLSAPKLKDGGAFAPPLRPPIQPATATIAEILAARAA